MSTSPSAQPGNQAGQAPASAPVDPGRRLTVKALPLNTFRENVVVLARNCAALRPERLSGLRKVEIRCGAHSILAAPMICDDPAVVGPQEAGLAQPALRRLGVSPGALVEIEPARPPASLKSVRAKIQGATLSDADYVAIARDLADHRWSDLEIAAFLVACAGFMTADETVSLSRGMIAAGRIFAWDRPLVVDKHCIGGIPGNRTSLIVVPIVAAHGLLMPKTSSRAITSPAGTADTMEVLARVDLDEDVMRAVVDHCGACITWGGRMDLSPADDVLISVERPLSIDTPAQMVASILSKKVAAGSTHLVLDIPVGPSAKVRDRQAAIDLKKLFEHVSGRLGIGIEVVLTDGTQPIGRGVGPVLEARDVTAVLRGDPAAPADLREKSIRLAARILERDPALPGGAGERRARELLESGAAHRKMDEIIEAQGSSPIEGRIGDLVHEVCAAQAGQIASIDCLQTANIARLAGAPQDPGAGIDFVRKAGETVARGDVLYRIHASEPSDFGFASETAGDDCGVRITP